MKRTLVLVTHPDCEVVAFPYGGGLEVLITSPMITREPTKVYVPKAEPGERISINRSPNVVEIGYDDDA